jgi:ribonuclease III
MPSTTSWPSLGPADPDALTGVRLSLTARVDAGSRSLSRLPGPGQPAEPLDVAPGAAEAREQLQALAERLGRRSTDLELLGQAVAHRSWCGETGVAESNERLEFLGDAVLGLVVAEYTYHRFPELPEGRLAKIRAAVVNARVLAEIAEELEIGRVLLLGRGEESSGGRAKPSILADALEAIIGAVYLDQGWEGARPMVLGLVEGRILDVAHAPDAFDHKSRLQELTVQRGVGTPRYVLHGSGPDHERRYVAEVFVGGGSLGSGEGTSKKDAEQQAARRAYEALLED